MKFSLKNLGAALLLGAAPLPALADMNAHLGPLAKLVTPGQAGDWRTEDREGWFTLINASAPGSIQYYWMSVPDAQGPDYTVSVNLVAQTDTPESLAYVGMIFNFRSKEQYFGVTVGTDGAGYLFIRTPNGFKSHQEKNVKARHDGSDVLTAQVTGNKVSFKLNGAQFASMDNPNGFSRKLGVIAIGQGLFGFTGFNIQ